MKGIEAISPIDNELMYKNEKFCLLDPRFNLNKSKLRILLVIWLTM